MERTSTFETYVSIFGNGHNFVYCLFHDVHYEGKGERAANIISADDDVHCTFLVKTHLDSSIGNHLRQSQIEHGLVRLKDG